MSGEVLDLKTLQSHLIKTVVGSVVAALVAGLSVGFSFYYKTNSAIDYLTTQQKETKTIVDKHTELISQGTNFNSVSDVQIKNLEQRMQSIEKTQQDIIKLLIEINSSQKIIQNQNK